MYMLAGKVNAPLDKVHSFIFFTLRGYGAKFVLGLAPAPVGATSAVTRHCDNDEEHRDWKLFIIDNIWNPNILFKGVRRL